jgi:chorismate mutase
MDDPATDPVVQELRRRISSVDREIVGAVNRRVALVGELHRYKAQKGYPLSDPAREAELIAELTRANPGPLSSDGLRAVYAAILAEWKREPAARRAAS